MSSEYRKKHIQAPTSYEQLTNNRPTKKKTFQYSINQQGIYDRIKPLHYNRSKVPDQDFSFQNTQSPHKTEETIIRRFPLSRQEESREEEMLYDSSPRKQLSKKHQIDERLSNITSINLKITGLLKAVKDKNQDTASVYTSPRNEEPKSKSSSIQDKKAVYLSDSVIEDQQAYRQKVRSALRTKYGLPTESISHNKDPVPNISPFKEGSFIQPNQIIKERQAQSNYIPPEKQNRLTSALISKQAEKLGEPLADTQLNVRINNQKKERILIENLILDRQIQEKKQKIFAGSPFNPKTDERNQAKEVSVKREEQTSPQIQKLTEKPQVLKLAESLSRLIQVDIVMFKFRQSFQSWKEPKKWAHLMTQLHAQNVYLEQNYVKELVSISIYQKNPFGNKNTSYSLNQSKDLAKMMAQAEHLWNDVIEKCVSLDLLVQDDFSMNVIDFSSKGSISLEDMVCFINVNSQRFYRSRDVAGLFKRFLKLQGKSLDKGISIGICYGTFMEKVSR